jgi:aspartyl-tRNA(Asn)/glutamyl-tRNA(Gln) amidotransferase subunit A
VTLADLPVEEAARLIREGELAPADYFEALSRTIDELEPSIHAFIGFDASAAAAAAAEAPREGRLAGIPIAVKDNIVTRQFPTTCGSKILRDFVSPFDATAVARLEGEGAWVAGKTNLDEFAMGSSTEHSAFGPTRNPWDGSRVPGGSSGGSAAAVAARMVPAALGSETGGSVRQPAAFCGITGLKPTYGRVSRSGLVAFASSLDQIGIFTRCARDAAILLGVMAGRDEADSTSSSREVPDYLDGIEEGVRGLRFGVVSDGVEEADGEVRASFEEALALFRDGGAEVVPIELPSLRHAIAVYSIVANAEASTNLARFDGVRYGGRSAGAATLRELYTRSRTEGFGDEVKRRIMLGTFALSAGYHDAYYARAQRVRGMIAAEFDGAFERCDILLSPTTPGAAFRIGEKTADPLSMYLQDVFTAPANLAGVPAIAIPAGFTRAGLPLSVQLTGPRFAEARLLRAARYMERQTEYHLRKPLDVAPREP